MAAELTTASRTKNGHSNVRCDCLTKVLQEWMDRDGRVEEEIGVFVLVNFGGAMFAAITRGDLDLR